MQTPFCFCKKVSKLSLSCKKHQPKNFLCFLLLNVFLRRKTIIKGQWTLPPQKEVFSLSFAFFPSFNAGYHYREEEKVYFLPFLFIISFVHIIHLLYHQGNYLSNRNFFWVKRVVLNKSLKNRMITKIQSCFCGSTCTYHEKAYFSMPCLGPTWFRFMKYATDQTYKTCLLKKMSK